MTDNVAQTALDAASRSLFDWKTGANPEHRTTRVQAPELNAVLGWSMPVLSGGFVRVVDYMGSDDSVVQAARVSYGAGTKTVRSDRDLIRYLLRHRHTTPFEMATIKLHVRAPIDVLRQWLRHRTASANEYSTRYSEAIDAVQIPTSDAFRHQSTTNRQGSGDVFDLEDGQQLKRIYVDAVTGAQVAYSQLLTDDVAREQARAVLPLGTYSEMYWQVNLHNLLHFLNLRTDSGAQEEIRAYANVIASVLPLWVPLVTEAWYDYQMGAVTLTALDITAMRMLMVGTAVDEQQVRESTGMTKREYGEFIEKMALAGIGQTLGEVDDDGQQ